MHLTAERSERLVVSLNTVRFHVKEIYGKLGVNFSTTTSLVPTDYMGM